MKLSSTAASAEVALVCPDNQETASRVLVASALWAALNMLLSIPHNVHQEPGSLQRLISFQDNYLYDCVQAMSSSPLAAAILFSSIASLTGPAGTANYAAANAVLDACAQDLQAQGTECSSCCPQERHPCC